MIAAALGLALWVISAPAVAQNMTKLIPVVSTGAEATAGSKVICTSGCNVTSIYATAAAVSVYLMTFNQTTVPADGAVPATLRDCVFIAAGTTAAVDYGGIADTFQAGMALAFSSTGCDVKTVAAVKFFKARKS